MATYLQMESVNGKVSCMLVMGRSRVAPLKTTTTIPRLELTAEVVAARMDHKLHEELGLQLEESVFWSDSTSVLKCLFSVKLTPITAWRYVDTAKNLADLASRGIAADSLLTSKMWFQGPAFLTGPESSWPATPSDVKIATLKDNPEVK
ncbi:uncharacterized protein [Macrobrachium rosenbergii]|uniref:uncharacterized protein n=1 Tax=Macrobrachium rosenbergii TaxID=79674 RepID=UPI0034D5765D